GVKNDIDEMCFTNVAVFVRLQGDYIASRQLFLATLPPNHSMGLIICSMNLISGMNYFIF
ncbi:MAG: hypothetical protein ILP23_03780, partial [Paludibacteraceae bacterium]|nr:hypothetical protein [Paludibacteraceae bacterium]